MWAAEAHNYSFYLHPSDKKSAVSYFLSREENSSAVNSLAVRNDIPGNSQRAANSLSSDLIVILSYRKILARIFVPRVDRQILLSSFSSWHEQDLAAVPSLFRFQVGPPFNHCTLCNSARDAEHRSFRFNEFALSFQARIEELEEELEQEKNARSKV